MKKRYLVLCGLVSVLTLAAGGASAEKLMKLPPEMRLSRGTTDQGEASQNVIVQPVDPKQLPSGVLEETRTTLASCFGKDVKEEALRAYSWTPERSRTQGLRPNLIVDYTGLSAMADKQKCEKNKVCDEEGCWVKGYTPQKGETGWMQDFEIRAVRFFFSSSPMGQKKRGEINALSNKKNCLAAGGVQTDGGCLRKFEWRNFGLSMLPVGR